MRACIQMAINDMRHLWVKRQKAWGSTSFEVWSWDLMWSTLSRSDSE